jgi:hypothetical protein
MYAIHKQVYRIHGSDIWYMANSIPENVHLETKFFIFTFKREDQTFIVGLRKTNIFFFLLLLLFLFDGT